MHRTRHYLLAAAVLLVSACQAPGPTPGSSAPAAAGTLTVRTSGPARSLSADWAARVDALEVTVAGLDGQPGRTLRVAAGADAVFEAVPAGRWKVAASALAQSKAVAYGEISPLVLGAAGRTVQVSLSGAQTGTGSYTYRFTVPASTGVDGVRFQLKTPKQVLVGPARDVSLTGSGEVLSGQVSDVVASGDYRLEAQFLRGTETALVAQEDLAVWDSVDSDLWTAPSGAKALTRDYTAADFAGPDTRLSWVDLTEGGAGLSSDPAFQSLIEEYAVFAGPGLKLQLFGATSGQTLAVRVDEGAWTTLTTGQPAEPFPVAAGNRIELKVTSPDGSGTRTYTYQVSGCRMTFLAPDAESGTVPVDPKIHTRGEQVLLPDNTFLLARTGFTFIGWTADWLSGGPVVAPGTAVDADAPARSWKAVWAPVSAAVAFDAAGGTGFMASQATQQGTPVSLPVCTYTRTGYTFTGWNTAADGGGTAYPAGGTVTVSGTILTLFAQWSPVTYHVLFHSNGGSGTMASQSFVYGQSQRLSATSFAYEGFTFVGWSLTAGGALAYGDSADFSAPAADTDLFALWTPAAVTVHFLPNGGSGTMADQGFTYGTSDSLAANAFTRTGYTFAGWAKNPAWAVAYTDGGVFTPPTSDTNLYAVWNANTYVLRFDAGAGTGSMMPLNWTYETPSALPAATFTRTGFQFAGWAVSSGGSVVYADLASYSIGAGPATLYAVWTPRSYQVTFQAQGGSGTMAGQTFTYGAAAPLTAVGFTRAGYTFAGWADTSGGAAVHADRSSYSVPAADTALYAVWTPRTYMVSYQAEGGTGSMSSQSFTYGTSPSLNPSAFTKTGYSFAGWAASSGGAVVYADRAAFVPPANDFTLYAVWTGRPYTLTLAANGGSGTMSAVPFTYGTSQTLPVCGFTRTGYDFQGWATTAGGAVSILDQGAYSIPAADTTLYAKWSLRVIHITFQPEGGAGTTGPQNTTYGTSTTLVRGFFTRTGYTFTGWATSPGGALAYADMASVTLTSDLVLYARWTANTYNVTFLANGGTGTMGTQAFTYGTPQSLNAAAFTSSGYTFAGWGLTSSGPPVYADGALFTTPAAATTLYALWSVNQTLGIDWGTGQSLTFSNPAPSVNRSANLSIVPTFTGGTGWKWYLDGLPVSTASSYLFNQAEPGVYSVSVTVSKNGLLYSGNVAVTVK